MMTRRGFSQVYVETVGKSHDQILEDAWNIASALERVGGFIKPVVVGPIHSLTEEMDRKFTKKSIRTTGFTFEQYVNDVSGV